MSEKSTKKRHKRYFYTTIGFIIIATLSVLAIIFASLNTFNSQLNGNPSSHNLAIELRIRGGCNITPAGCDSLRIYENWSYEATHNDVKRVGQLSQYDVAQIQRLLATPADQQKDKTSCGSDTDGADYTYIIHIGKYSGQYGTCEYRRSGDNSFSRYSNYNTELLDLLQKIIYGG